MIVDITYSHTYLLSDVGHLLSVPDRNGNVRSQRGVVRVSMVGDGNGAIARISWVDWMFIDDPGCHTPIMSQTSA